MLKKLLIAFALFASCALLLTACGGTDSNSNSNTSNGNSANKATTTESPAMASSPASTTASSTGEKIGVAECDDYLAKYEACVLGKVPEAARAQYKASLDQMRKSWRELAANPQTKAGLVQACKMATEQSRTQLKMYGCDF